jgi:hypothetical protein
MFLAVPRRIHAHELLVPHQPSCVICTILEPPDISATLQYIAFVPEQGAARTLWTRASQKKTCDTRVLYVVVNVNTGPPLLSPSQTQMPCSRLQTDISSPDLSKSIETNDVRPISTVARHSHVMFPSTCFSPTAFAASRVVRNIPGRQLASRHLLPVPASSPMNPLEPYARHARQLTKLRQMRFAETLAHAEAPMRLLVRHERAGTMTS